MIGFWSFPLQKKELKRSVTEKKKENKTALIEMQMCTCSSQKHNIRKHSRGVNGRSVFQ